MKDTSIEIPQSLENWVHQWLFEMVQSEAYDLDTHSRVTTFCRAISYDLYRHLSKPAEAPAIQVEGDSFGISEDDIKLLWENGLKPEEIGGEPAKRNDRIRELIRWFVRYAQRSANPKWVTGHAFELAYYIATNADYPSIDLEPIRMAAWKEGAMITPTERSIMERIGTLSPMPAAPLQPLVEKTETAAERDHYEQWHPQSYSGPKAEAGENQEVPEEIEKWAEEKIKEFADGMMFEPLEKMTHHADKMMHGAMVKAGKYMAIALYRYLSGRGMIKNNTI